MSAQIIDALRKRADVMEEKSMASVWHGQSIPGGSHVVYRLLAEEFRALADEAEGGS